MNRSLRFLTCALALAAAACSSPTPSPCANGAQDGDEEGVDCGGACAPCDSPASFPTSSEGTSFALAVASQGGDGASLVVAPAAAVTGSALAELTGFTASCSAPAVSATTMALPDALSSRDDGISYPPAVAVSASARTALFAASAPGGGRDGVLVLPEGGLLGTEYVVVATAVDSISQLQVVALEDGTTVTITTTESCAIPAYQPHTEMMTRGQAFQLRAIPDLTGTLIEADRPVAVFAGGEGAAWEQLLPVSRWGAVYAFPGLSSSPSSGAYYRIVGSRDNTMVHVGATTYPLHSQRFLELYLNGPVSVEATAPVEVAILDQGSMMSLLPPAGLWVNDASVAALDGFETRLAVTLPNDPAATVAVDGTDVPASSFAPIGESGFKGGLLDVSPGYHRVTGPERFGLVVLGSASGAGYGWPGGFRTPDATCADADGDGFFSAPACGSRVDCDELRAGVRPFAPESCNGRDDDCDTTIDEGAERSVANGTLQCDSGTPSLVCTAGWFDANSRSDDGCECAPSGSTETVCDDQVDDDCDGLVDRDDDDCPQCVDDDTDGYDRDGLCGPADCNDLDPNAYPNAPVLAGDDIDEDCSGFVACFEDADADGHGSNMSFESTFAASGGVAILSGACGSSLTDQWDDDPLDCDDSSAATFPGAAEIESGTACMRDADGDGRGDANVAWGVDQGSDCNDAASSCTDDCSDGDFDGVVDCVDLCGDPDLDDYGTDWSARIVGSGAIPVASCTVDGVTPCTFGDAACIGPE